MTWLESDRNGEGPYLGSRRNRRRYVAVLRYAIPEISLAVATPAYRSRTLVRIDDVGIAHAAFGGFGAWRGHGARRHHTCGYKDNGQDFGLHFVGPLNVLSHTGIAAFLNCATNLQVGDRPRRPPKPGDSDTDRTTQQFLSEIEKTGVAIGGDQLK
jgi:hypothetical protein